MGWCWVKGWRSASPAEVLGTLAALCLPRDQRVSLLTPFVLAMASEDQAPGVQQRRYRCGPRGA